MANAWDRLPEEPERWYQRFLLFRNQKSAQRTLIAAYRAANPKSKSNEITLPWRDAARKWQWQDRATAWDKFLQEQDDAAWIERRKEQREREWAMASRLMQKAESILDLPITIERQESEVKDEETGAVVKRIVTIMPVDVRARDAAAIAKTATDIARLSAEMETGEVRVKLDWQDSARKAGVDPDAVKRKLRDVIAGLGAGQAAPDLAGTGAGGSDSGGELSYPDSDGDAEVDAA